jgi:3-oxoacyl-[acyl-carrier protein] reductase
MKTYLFAGASSEIAKQTAIQLQEEGHTVIGLSTQSNAFNYDALFTVAKYDSTDYPVIDQIIDGLVYFPGTINLKPFHRLTHADFIHDYNVNTLGAAAFIQAYLPHLKKSTSPSIVLMSSVAVAVGMPFHSSISMAKGAVEGLTKSLSAELAPAIRVNCIAPSLTKTPLGEKFMNTPEKIENSQKRNPMRKIGEPHEVADAIQFLLSEKASWITGQTIAVDGGMNVLK